MKQRDGKTKGKGKGKRKKGRERGKAEGGQTGKRNGRRRESKKKKESEEKDKRRGKRAHSRIQKKRVAASLQRTHLINYFVFFLYRRKNAVSEKCPINALLQHTKASISMTQKYPM